MKISVRLPREPSPLPLDEEVAMACGTVRQLLEDVDDADVIPLPNVTREFLSALAEYTQGARGLPECGKVRETYNAAFCSAFDADQLAAYVAEANFLDAALFFEALVERLADMVKGKSVEEMRRVFGIENDFTPEEEEQLRRENAWAFD